MGPGSAPQRVGQAHGADQLANFEGDLWPAAATARFPSPNPNGGSVALGHPLAATGARILSQALKELAALPKGSRAIVSICADGGLGTVALLEH
jgi:acetyl-CoA acetyltransferase